MFHTGYKLWKKKTYVYHMQWKNWPCKSFHLSSDIRHLCFLLFSLQPPRYQPAVVPHSFQSCETLDLQPVQVAGHQDCHGSAAAGLAGYFPLQHAWLHGQENAGSLRCCNDTCTRFQQFHIPDAFLLLFLPFFFFYFLFFFFMLFLVPCSVFFIKVLSCFDDKRPNCYYMF